MILTDEQRDEAASIIAKYPNPRSATLPLLFYVQSVEGYVSEAGMKEVASMLGSTPAEVLAVASFYSMFKKRPQGEYLISVCRNISCTHRGSRAVLSALEDRLSVSPGQTTSDGRFSLEEAECLATCDGAPSIQVNYEDFYSVSPDEAVAIVDRLERDEDVVGVRGERVKTSREIARETALAGAWISRGSDEVPTPGLPTVGGESQPAGLSPSPRSAEGGPGA